MSRFKKLINIIYYLMSIIVLAVLLLMLNSENYFTQQILDMITSNENVMLVIKVLGAIVGVAALLKLLGTILQKTDEKYLYLFDDDGEVCVSNTAIEKTVKNALREFEEVIEYTVKIKIKNKEEKSKVSVKIKCGLDEAVCRGKGYYDYVNDNEKAENMSLEEKESEKSKNTSETDTEGSKKESDAGKAAETAEKTVQNAESAEQTADNAKCTGETEEKTSDNAECTDKTDEPDEKSSELEKTVEYRISDVNNETEKEENLAPEIIEAMSVISGDISEEKSDENSEETSEEQNKAESDLKSKDADSVKSSKKSEENGGDVKKIASMSIDDLCSTIQVYTHDCLQEFLSQRVDRVDIKFYDVKVKEKVHNRPKQQKKQQKNTNKKINRKNKRVN